MILNVQRARAERVEIRHPVLARLCAWRVGNRVGESPIWDAEARTLLWIDVRAPAVLRLDPDTDEVTRWELPGVVGAMGLGPRGCVVLALQRSLAMLELCSGKLTDLESLDAEPSCNRLNDGKVSPSGRWFVFGSMDDRPTGKLPTGSLYVAGSAGLVRLLHAGLTVANGLAFSPDASTIYFSDSHAGRVWRAPWNEMEGRMGPAKLMCSCDEAAGRPDGAAVDCDGNYWSAGVSAGVLNQFNPEGALLAMTRMPCRAPTMPCFGGLERAEIYVTSLVRPGWKLGPADLDGALFRYASATSGLSAPRWG